jgi:hypothetical protein
MLSNDTTLVAVGARMYLYKLFEVRKRFFYVFRPFLPLYVMFSDTLNINGFNKACCARGCLFCAQRITTGASVAKRRYLYGTATAHIPVSTDVPVYTGSYKF